MVDQIDGLKRVRMCGGIRCFIALLKLKFGLAEAQLKLVYISSQLFSFIERPDQFESSQPSHPGILELERRA